MYSPRLRLLPTREQRDAMDWQRNVARQLHNHALREFDTTPEDAGTLRQRVWQVRGTLPALKDWWTDLTQVYTTEYDAIFAEDLGVTGMLETLQNARDKAEVG